METGPGGTPPLAQWPLRRPRLAGTLPGSARNLNLLVRDADAMFCFAREDRASNVIRADVARAFLEPFELTALEREALPHFVVATQARTAPRYRVRAREGADPARVLRAHVARMRTLSANVADLG